MHKHIRGNFCTSLLLGLMVIITAVSLVSISFRKEEIEEYVLDQVLQIIEASREFKNNLVSNPLRQPDKD